MPYVPFLIPITWLVGLLSLALLGGGVYLLWAWYVGAVVGTAYLVCGLVATAWTFLGHRVVLLLMRRSGRDEPKATRDGEVRRVARPDGSDLQVEVYGPPSGPTILMTHGLGTHSTAWYYAKKQLAGRFRLVVWDLPGLGKSRGPSNADYSLEKLAHDLEAVLQLAGDGPVILLGHSLGGLWSAWSSSTRPTPTPRRPRRSAASVGPPRSRSSNRSCTSRPGSRRSPAS